MTDLEHAPHCSRPPVTIADTSGSGRSTRRVTCPECGSQATEASTP